MGYDPLEVAGYYSTLFLARSDAYSAWNTRFDPPGWRPVRAPLTPEIILNGLTKKGPSVSGYMLGVDNTTQVFALDFDTDNGWEEGLDVGRAMTDDRIDVYVEASRRGSHLWGVMSRPLPGKTVRRFLMAYLDQLKLKDPKIELRPGQDEIRIPTDPDEPPGLGMPLRLPTMPHPKTGKRYALSHPYTGKPIGDSLSEMLLCLQIIDADLVITKAMEYVPWVDPQHIRKEYLQPRPQRPDEYANASASDILRDLWGAMRAQPGRAIKCPAHPDSNPSLSILRDDKRVICRGPGCILNNDGHGRGTYELTKLAPART